MKILTIYKELEQQRQGLNFQLGKARIALPLDGPFSTLE